VEREHEKDAERCFISRRNPQLRQLQEVDRSKNVSVNPLTSITDALLDLARGRAN